MFSSRGDKLSASTGKVKGRRFMVRFYKVEFDKTRIRVRPSGLFRSRWLLRHLFVVPYKYGDDVALELEYKTPPQQVPDESQFRLDPANNESIKVRQSDNNCFVVTFTKVAPGGDYSAYILTTLLHIHTGRFQEDKLADFSVLRDYTIPATIAALVLLGVGALAQWGIPKLLDHPTTTPTTQPSSPTSSTPYERR